MCMVMCFFFFFSSRRRHTRCREVSWARRCVQETGINAEYMGKQKRSRMRDSGLKHIICQLLASTPLNTFLLLTTLLKIEKCWEEKHIGNSIGGRKNSGISSSGLGRGTKRGEGGHCKSFVSIRGFINEVCTQS
eukprot:TRINITY_DN1027_c0_g1_i6.p2 TRINITY_DN1027_c0_g1~~TRINITY_DN1027_c0_g1_i6.p2  ORF type:complete len:134 (-),score=39.58 TRINITY_DN1027_c0_g1_i6:61-462(-)